VAQHDYVIANGTGAAVRSDLNNGLAAIVSQNSGTTEPTTTYAYMRWADTAAGVMKMRNGANNAWITLYQLDGEWSTIAFENGSASAPSIYFKDSGTDTGIYSPGTDQVAISTAGTGRLFVNASGNVGIGTTSVSDQFVISNGGAGGLEIGTATNAPVIQAYNRSGAAYVNLTDACSNRIFQTGGNTERARIDSSGRLLVGTSTALSNVYIKGDLGSSTATTPPLQLAVTGASYAGASITSFSSSGYAGTLSLGSSSSNTIGGNTIVVNTQAVGVVSFNGNDGTNFIPCAEIKGAIDGTPGANDMPGRIVLSTTADGASSPTERVRINQSGAFKASIDGTYDNSSSSVHEFKQTGSSNVLQVFNSNTSVATDGLLFVRGNRNTTNGTWYFFDCYNNASGTYKFRIADSGTATNTTGTYGTISDAKLKTDIVDAPSQWNDVKNLRFRKYRLINDPSDVTYLGVVAQEVEQVSPGLVEEHLDRDSEGNDLGTATKSVKTSILLMKAAVALQEAMERIEQLETEMAAVKAQLS
jgi:hypothetical protein